MEVTEKITLDMLTKEGAVSYTHLDVYKRQPVASSAAIEPIVIPLM